MLTALKYRNRPFKRVILSIGSQWGAMHSISRFRTRFAMVLSLSFIFSVEPYWHSAEGIEPVADRKCESISLQRSVRIEPGKVGHELGRVIGL
jgi:hypothetical protein